MSEKKGFRVDTVFKINSRVFFAFPHLEPDIYDSLMERLIYKLGD